MGWARIDDGFHDHPKLIGLSLEALGLWTKCLTWAHRHHGTGPLLGHIPAGLPAMFAQARGAKLAEELVRHHLWDVEEHLGGWAIHDYSDFLPAAERPETASNVSRARSEAGRLGAAARWGKRPTPDPNPDHPPSQVATNAKQADSKLLEPGHRRMMPPTRPDPIAKQREGSDDPSLPHGGRQRPPAKPKPHRIPADFATTDRMRDWATESAPSIDIASETANFVDYWTAAATANARKLDWVAAWRTWMRNAATRQVAPPGRSRISSLDRRQQQYLETEQELARREAARGRNRSEPAALPAFGIRPA